MLPKDLPLCINDRPICLWHSGGGSFGGDLNFQNFKCECGQRAVLLMGLRQKALLLFLPEGSVDEQLNDYVNDKLMAFWRDAKEKDQAPGIPPEIPEGFTAFVLEDGIEDRPNWQRKNTKGIVAPEDPIFTKHKRFWAILLAQLGIRNYRTIKNEYCGSRLEPWYEFQLYGCTWKMGPRKRVTVIEISCPDRTLDFTALKLMAKTDQATVYDYSEQGGFVGVHAWTRKKILEYFYLLLSPIAAAADDEANSLQFPEPSQVEAPKPAPTLTRADMDEILQSIQIKLVEKFRLDNHE